MQTRLELIQRLANLEAKLDPLLFDMKRDPQTGQWSDDGDDSSVVKPVVGGLAVGAGGVSAVLGHNAIMRKYGATAAPGAIGALNSAGGAYKAAGADALAVARKAGAKYVNPLLRKLMIAA